MSEKRWEETCRWETRGEGEVEKCRSPGGAATSSSAAWGPAAPPQLLVLLSGQSSILRWFWVDIIEWTELPFWAEEACSDEMIHPHSRKQLEAGWAVNGRCLGMCWAGYEGSGLPRGWVIHGPLSPSSAQGLQDLQGHPGYIHITYRYTYTCTSPHMYVHAFMYLLTAVPFNL